MKLWPPLVAGLISVAGLIGCVSTTALPWGPTTIASDWSEFRFAQAVIPVFRYQELVLELDEPGARAEFVKYPDGATERPIHLALSGGRSVDAFAEAIMTDGTRRPLHAWGHACANDRGCDVKFGDNFKGKDRIQSVRLRASSPIRIKTATWVDYDPR